MDQTAQHNTANTEQIERAQETWHAFTKLAKWATVGIIIGVILLVVITLSFP